MPPPTPQLKAIITCDYVITEANSNKRSLIGIFDRIYITRFPGTYFPIWLYVAFSEALGDYNIRVEFRDLEQNKVLGEARSSNPLHCTRRDRINEVIFRFPPTPFPHEGDYEMVVYANDQILGQKKIEAILRR